MMRSAPQHPHPPHTCDEALYEVDVRVNEMRELLDGGTEAGEGAAVIGCL